MAQQQPQQHTVVAVEPGLTFGFGVAATLCRQQACDCTEQRPTEQRRSADDNGQQAQHAAEWVTLQEDLAETIAQGRGPVGAMSHGAINFLEGERMPRRDHGIDTTFGLCDICVVADETRGCEADRFAASFFVSDYNTLRAEVICREWRSWPCVPGL